MLYIYLLLLLIYFTNIEKNSREGPGPQFCYELYQHGVIQI
jgi:hypothetical protein